MNNRFRMSTILPIALFAVMGVVLALGLRNDPKVLPSMLQDRPIPVFDLPALKPELPGLKSASFTNNGVTIINVFASWCASCRYEHPFLMRLASEKRAKLVGLNWKDNEKDANKYLTTYGNPYSAIGTDESGRAGIDLGVTGAPETFVIDTQGRVRLRVPGPLTPEIWNGQIEPLINGKTPS